MSDQAKLMPPQISNIHNATIANIEFFKKQQWAITNYSVAIYVGIFGVAKSMERLTVAEQIVLTALAVMTAVIAALLLYQTQRDLSRHRTRLQKIRSHWLSENERQTCDIEPYKALKFRGFEFFLSLVGVIFIGAAIVVYSLWR